MFSNETKTNKRAEQKPHVLHRRSFFFLQFTHETSRISLLLRMSSDKSKLKTDVLRGEPFCTAALHLTEDVRACAPPEHLHEIRCVIEDGSVRYAGGPPVQQQPDGDGAAAEATGETLMLSFWRSIEHAFNTCLHLHTYVLLFDKKRWVPVQKRETQQARRKTLAETSVRRDVEPWTWDGTSPIIAMRQRLPPWPRLRLDSAAYGRALEELVALMAQHFVPPVGCRILIDWPNTANPGVPLVIETTADGGKRVRHEEGLANTVGEADMAAQRYARMARSGQLGPPGAVSLFSTDTDFLPLSVLHDGFARNEEHGLWLNIGRCSVIPPRKFCSKNEPGAVARGELYDIVALVRSIATTVPAASLPFRDGNAAFVAFCTAAGNDFVSRRYGITHKIMHAAHCRSPMRFVWTTTTDGLPTALVTIRSYVDFLRHCYWERLAARNRPAVVPAYRVLAHIVRTAYTNEKAHMPTADQVMIDWRALCWALAYACRGVHGAAAILYDDDDNVEDVS